MNKLRWISLLLGLAVLIPTIARGEGNKSAAVIFEIPQTVTVSGTKIFFSDLGVVIAGSTDISGGLKRIDLGTAPAPGQVRVFSRKYLDSIIHQYDFPVEIDLRMGEQVVVRSTATCIQGAEIEKAIQNLLAEKKPHLIKKWVELRNLPETLWLSQGDWSVKALPIGNLPEVGTALFKVVLTKGRENKTLNISGKIRANALVYVALRDISYQAEIKQTDFELTERELQSGKELLSEVPGQIRSTKTIKRGEILRNDWIQLIPLVSKDHEVTVIVRDENVIINIVGIAKADGWLGDEILIKNPVSNKTFKAKVIGNGIAEVNSK